MTAPAAPDASSPAASAAPSPAPSVPPDRAASRLRRWFRRWGPVLPLLIAEGTIWVGFGALLPILPIWFTQHGTDLPTLGVVIAAWPAARLFGEPVFGRLADTGPRKAMMITGLLLTSVFALLPLFITGPLAFLVLRAMAGLTTAIYDPAARGYLVDATPPERQGETFGMYAAAQMGGLMLGPAIGGVAAAITNDPAIVFWVASVSIVVSAALVAARVPEIGHGRRAAAAMAEVARTGSAAETAEGPAASPTHRRPADLRNRLLMAALVINVGSYFAGGVYEVVWSLYLTSLGASLGVIGLTFASFGLPILLLSPFTGRLIDRVGGYLPLVGGMLLIAVCGALYPTVPEIWFVVALGLVEGVGFAFATPAIFALVARGSPAERSSTAQGVFGAAGTVGTIVASLLTGVLAAVDLRAPFFTSALVALVTLLLALVIGRGRIRPAMAPRPHGPGTPV